MTNCQEDYNSSLSEELFFLRVPLFPSHMGREKGNGGLRMDLDERLEMEQDMNLTLGPAKHQVRLTALLLIIGQYEQTTDTNQLIEDMATLGIQVIK